MKKEIFAFLLQRIDNINRRGPKIIGITGIDCSGKTQFTIEFEQYLIDISRKVQIIHMDDFHHPKNIRYQGADQSNNYYNKSFNYAYVINELLDPIHKHNSFEKKLLLLDVEKDRYCVKKTYTIDQKSIVLFEGVFLFRPELIKYLDLKIFLRVPFDIALQRAKKRDQHLENVEHQYNKKYFKAQSLYLTQIDPKKKANILINNSDYNNPIIEHSD